jgi:hypothetical protein
MMDSSEFIVVGLEFGGKECFERYATGEFLNPLAGVPGILKPLDASRTHTISHK